jgi:aminoglycoside phosphotransferase (APT) family kinase protein
VSVDRSEAGAAAKPSSDHLPGIDLRLAGGWVEGLGIGATGPFTAAQIGHGKSNLTYMLTDAKGSQWVLRRPPLGKLLPSAHDVAREHRVISALVETPVPVPVPIALRPPDAALEVPLLLMEYVAGHVIDSDESASRTDVARRREIGLSLPRTLAEVHAVGIDAVGLADLGSRKPYAERQLRRWRQQFEDSKTHELPLVEELADRLEAAVPTHRETTLVHGDFHLLNVIFDPDGSEVRAILDWELCTLGDPLADLGGLLAYWPQADDPGPPAPTPFPARPGFPSRAELVDAYAEASGRDVSAIGFWETLGCWKVAIIAAGVLRRRLDEPDNGDPEESRETVELMLARALRAADHAAI